MATVQTRKGGLEMTMEKAKRLVVVLFAMAFLLGSCNFKTLDPAARPEPVIGAHHIVALGDPHYSGNLSEMKNEAKNAVIASINEWPDVKLVAVVGDLCETVGTPAEYEAAGVFMEKLKKPKALIVGNHDYFYKNELAGGSDPDPADSATRAAKLEQFMSTFGINALYYSRPLGDYILIFLSTDNLTSEDFAAMSTAQLDWFRAELAKNRNTPTIVFFHAPLKGTLIGDDRSKFFAQPDGEIAPLLKENPQVFLWVSGHIHRDEFQLGDKLYLGRVYDVALSDMDRWTIRTASLYLYPDRVVIRAWNHRKGFWEDGKDVTVARPAL
jgi:Icc protein